MAVNSLTDIHIARNIPPSNITYYNVTSTLVTNLFITITSLDYVNSKYLWLRTYTYQIIRILLEVTEARKLQLKTSHILIVYLKYTRMKFKMGKTVSYNSKVFSK